MITKVKEQNHTLDIIKVVCAILIVFNHCVFPQEFGKIVKDLSRVSVPIFFMISGYYSYNNDYKKLLKKTKRIALMLLGGCLFWFLFTIIRYAIISPIEIRYYFYRFIDPIVLLKFFFFNENMFWGHLWFLNALTYCYLINYFGKKAGIKDNSKIQLSLSIILLIGYFIINHFFLHGDYNNAYLIRNFLYVGIPFYLIGKNIHHLKLDEKVNKWIPIITIVTSIIILFIERELYASEIYLSTILMAISIFGMCVKYPNLKLKKLEFIGSKLNIYIYIVHPAVKYVILDILEKMKITNLIAMYLYPLFALVISVVIAYLLYKFNTTIKNTINR